MLREILDSLPLPAASVDADGRITHGNAAAADILGADAVGQDLRFIGPEGRVVPWGETAAGRAAAAGKPSAAASVVVVGADGRRVAVEVRASPTRDADGRVSGAVVVMKEGFEADTGLARLAAIVASSEDAIVSKTLDGVVTSWNDGATRIFGYSADEMIGQPIILLIPPDLHGEEENILARLRRGERVAHFDTERLTRDGRRVAISVTISPIRNSAGEIVGASKVARDITERKRAEETQRLLVGELNHRVKNMLATVQAIARQSLRSEPTPAAFLASLNGRVRALALAHDILVAGDMQRADLADLIRVEVEPAGDDARMVWSGPPVLIDSRTTLQLALVLHELATNARRHGALAVPEGRLAVTWKILKGAGERELALDWCETGTGQRWESWLRGFGTTLIERSLASNGGQTSMRSVPDGFAWEIRLPLPALPATGAAPEIVPGMRSPQPAPVALPLSGLRILVVEDEPLIAMDIEERLLAEGADVIGPAANLEAARRLIAETSPDVALLDANLAGVPVDDLAVALRGRGIPFAFATGFGRASLPEDFADIPLLPKPFGSEQLLETVRVLLAARERERVAVPER